MPKAFRRNQVGLRMCGMRQYDDNNRWTGQPSFVKTGEVWSRCLLLGMNAVQVGFSKYPDMDMEPNRIDKISEVVLDVWMGAQKTKWEAESRGDYDDAEVTNLDTSAVAIDVRVDTN